MVTSDELQVDADLIIPSYDNSHSASWANWQSSETHSSVLGHTANISAFKNKHIF